MSTPIDIDDARQTRHVESVSAVTRLTNGLEPGDEIVWVTGAVSGSDDRTEPLTVTGTNGDIVVEGPRGGGYTILTSTSPRPVVRYSGKTGQLKELTLVSRNGSTVEAQNAYDDIFASYSTVTTDRPCAVVDPLDDSLGPDDDYHWLCWLGDIAGETHFCAMPTTHNGDHHIDRTVSTKYGPKLAFADNYTVMVEQDGKADVKALDWDSTHATWTGDEWAVDRDALAHVVEHLVEDGETGTRWSVSVEPDYAEQRSEHIARGLAPIGATGRRRDDSVRHVSPDDVTLPDGIDHSDTDGQDTFRAMGRRFDYSDDDIDRLETEHCRGSQYDLPASGDEYLSLSAIDYLRRRHDLTATEVCERFTQFDLYPMPVTDNKLSPTVIGNSDVWLAQTE